MARAPAAAVKGSTNLLDAKTVSRDLPTGTSEAGQSPTGGWLPIADAPKDYFARVLLWVEDEFGRGGIVEGWWNGNPGQDRWDHVGRDGLVPKQWALIPADLAPPR